MSVRRTINENLLKWKNGFRPWCVSEEELEGKLMEQLGESSYDFLLRVSGKTKGANRWGSNVDIGLYTLHLDIRVVVINAEKILRGTPDADLHCACEIAAFDGESPKLRYVCAILRDKHYQLGVVYAPHPRVVFEEGSAWQSALELILSYVRARAPLSKGLKGEPLSAVWEPPVGPEETGEGFLLR